MKSVLNLLLKVVGLIKMQNATNLSIFIVKLKDSDKVDTPSKIM